MSTSRAGLLGGGLAADDHDVLQVGDGQRLAEVAVADDAVVLDLR